MDNTIVLNNPLIKHKLAILRDERTSTKEFREIISELSTCLCYEALSDAKLREEVIKTPICETTVQKINEKEYAFVPILRAGTGMLDGLINIMPNAEIGHIGLYRDPRTLEPVEYYYKMPKDIQNREAIILDPMLATGGSSCATIDRLKKDGVQKIKFLCIIASPEGVKKISGEHPDVKIFTCSIDERLNEIGYIVPGLGDAGDRIFGTK